MERPRKLGKIAHHRLADKLQEFWQRLLSTSATRMEEDMHRAEERHQNQPIANSFHFA